MNWNEKAHKAAVPELLKASQDASRAGRIPSIQAPFVAAAKWQRDQLRTKEAVERVERVLLDELEGIPISDREFTRIAHTAITALLGQEPRP